MKILAGQVRDVLTSLNISYEEVGDELYARCPAHRRRTGRTDRSPSWSINERTGLHFCFSCGWRGNLYTFILEMQGERTARAYMRRHETPVPVGYRVRRDRPRPTLVVCPVLKTLPESRLAFYTDPPRWALDNRRISMDSVDLYGAMWDDKRSAWVFPLRSPDDNALLGVQIKGERTRSFRNSPIAMEKSKTLFGLDAMGGDEAVVVVESPLDAMLLSELGFHALAVCGARVSVEQAGLLRQFPCVYFAFDNDQAGMMEADRMRREFAGTRFRIVPPYEGAGKDFGETPLHIVSKSLSAVGL